MNSIFIPEVHFPIIHPLAVGYWPNLWIWFNSFVFNCRYPNDTYDRIWYSDSKIIQNISMYEIVLNQSIVSPNENFPPSVVMQTARSSIYPSVMSFALKANYGPGSYYIAFYFTSINSSFLAPLSLSIGNQSATVDISTPKKVHSDNYTVYGDSYSCQQMTHLGDHF